MRMLLHLRKRQPQQPHYDTEQPAVFIGDFLKKIFIYLAAWGLS